VIVRRPPEAVLFDRDGTLVVDVPYNGDPARVRPVPGAGAALDLLRAARIPAGVITNQSGIARGLITTAEMQQVNRRSTCYSARSRSGRSAPTARRTAARAASRARAWCWPPGDGLVSPLNGWP
jgi:beta-phosphoglucomutase-like phosphatase (HAD superfamily)